MSLKAFHLFFIAASIVLTLAFGAWGIVDYESSHSRTNLAMGIASLVFSAALVVYGGYAVRKLKGVNLL